jgi:hypothetical protein
MDENRTAVPATGSRWFDPETVPNPVSNGGCNMMNWFSMHAKAGSQRLGQEATLPTKGAVCARQTGVWSRAE